MNGEQHHEHHEHHRGHMGGEHCMCCHIIDMFLHMTGLRNEAAMDHFRNSRVEFLKGIRSLLDERIDAISRSGEQGSSIKVE